MKTTSKIKFELWVLNLIVFSGIFVGCGIPANESVVPEQPPELQVIYQTNDSRQKISVKSTTSEWTTITGADEAETVNSCGESPLSGNVDVIDLDGGYFKIMFDYEPNICLVGYWSDDNLNRDGDMDEITMVEYTENEIVLPDASQGYVYEIHAYWDQGDVYYNIHVK